MKEKEKVSAPGLEVKTFSVEGQGIGRPDYSEEVHDITRGKVYPELRLDPVKEKWKVFVNSFPPGSPLAAGATAPLLDIETFLPAPYISPKGWYVRFAEWMGSFNQATMLMTTLDNYPPFLIFLPVQGDTHEYEKIPFLDTKYWDPDTLSHNWNFLITNTSANPALGSVQCALIMEKAGTETMTHKTVRCPQCKHGNKVPIEQNRIVCESCRCEFVVPFFGGSVI